MYPKFYVYCERIIQKRYIIQAVFRLELNSFMSVVLNILLWENRIVLGSFLIITIRYMSQMSSPGLISGGLSTPDRNLYDSSSSTADTKHSARFIVGFTYKALTLDFPGAFLIGFLVLNLIFMFFLPFLSDLLLPYSSL